jgi:hypothetical protein
MRAFQPRGLRAAGRPWGGRVGRPWGEPRWVWRRVSLTQKGHTMDVADSEGV